MNAPAIAASGRVDDGAYGFAGGVNSVVSPLLIQPGQYRWSGNTVNRGGIVQTRPGFSSVIDLPSGNFQGSTLYRPKSGQSYLVAAVDGQVYVSRAPFDTYYRLATVNFRKGAPRVYFAVATQNFKRNSDGSLSLIDANPVLFMQDGYSRCAYWDGRTAGHLNPEKGYTDGFSTLTTAAFTQPLVNQEVDVAVVTNSGFVAGSVVTIPGVGVYFARTLINSTTVRLRLYDVTGGVQPGTSVPAGSTLQSQDDRIYTPGFNSVPTGTIMQAAGDRLWVLRGNQLFASDRGNPFEFTESNILASGPFLLPEPGTGMIETTDRTSLLVFTNTTTSAFASGLARTKPLVEARDNQTNGSLFQRILFPDIGCVGERSIVVHHGLIWWYSQFGFINLNSANNNTFNSQITNLDSAMLFSKGNLSPDLSGIVATAHENYLVCSVPSGDIRNRHTWVYDLAPMEAGSQAAWNSVWTGVRPASWNSGEIDGVQRTVLVSYDYDQMRTVTTSPFLQPAVGNTVTVQVQDSSNIRVGFRVTAFGNGGDYIVTAVVDARTVVLELVEGLAPTASEIPTDSVLAERRNRVWEAFTADRSDNGNPITCWIETRAHAVGNPMELKKFSYASLWLAELSGTSRWKVHYKGRKGAWKQVLNKSIEATQGIIGLDSYSPITADSELFGTKPQHRRLVTDQVVNEVNGVNSGESIEGEEADHIDYQFSLLIVWCGRGGVEGYRMFVDPYLERSQGVAEKDEVGQRIVADSMADKLTACPDCAERGAGSIGGPPNGGDWTGLGPDTDLNFGSRLNFPTGSNPQQIIVGPPVPPSGIAPPRECLQWTPDESTVCAGTLFAQTTQDGSADCVGKTRQRLGTMDCSVGPSGVACADSVWVPGVEEVCGGVSFTQVSNCGNVRTAVGQKNCGHGSGGNFRKDECLVYTASGVKPCDEPASQVAQQWTPTTPPVPPTPPGPPTPPEVSIVSPPSGSTIAPTLELTATALQGTHPLSRADLYINGVAVQSQSGSGPYIFSYDWSSLGYGTVNAKVVINDTLGYTGETTRSFVRIPSTPPTCQITAPITGSTIGGTSVAVTVHATDAFLMSTVQIFLDDVFQGNATLQSGTMQDGVWGTTIAGLTGGAHIIRAVAVSYGSYQTPDSVTLNVDTAGPVVSITSPAASSITSSSTQVVDITATDDVAIDHVEVYVGGVLAGTASHLGGSSYQFTASLAVGANIVMARAIDTLSNSTDSTPITVVRRASAGVIWVFNNSSETITTKWGTSGQSSLANACANGSYQGISIGPGQSASVYSAAGPTTWGLFGIWRLASTGLTDYSFCTPAQAARWTILGTVNQCGGCPAATTPSVQGSSSPDVWCIFNG